LKRRKAWCWKPQAGLSYIVTMLEGKTYLPAAAHDWLLPFYDPFVKLLGGDTARRVLLDQATVRPGHRVLDIGCGTGTLAMLIKRRHPDL
jgi:ubiquinone/menaquinone biosynthesis C-methylase UbiE